VNLIKRLERNTAGRDFIVGDIHGHFAKLNEELWRIEFDRKRDRLFSVGDLVDRGPQSHLVLDWLAEPWFHAVLGNHEQMALLHYANTLPESMYAMNGGVWYMQSHEVVREKIADAFAKLPMAIELKTESGIVGIVHASCDYRDWNGFVGLLTNEPGSREEFDALDNVIWGRGRIDYSISTPVNGVRAVVVGHTPCKSVTVLGNVHHIDTGGWLKGGHFTLINSETLQPA
jgi:serine/threonine protein phosphatase 1